MAGKADPVLLEGGPDEEVSVIIRLDSQPDPYKALDANAGRAKRQRIERVVPYLQNLAATSQKNLLKRLGGMRAAGRARSVRAYWIINAVSATMTRTAVAELAALPEVSYIYPDGAVLLEEPAAVPPSAEQNIDLVNAPAMWAMGCTGQGVVVAGMDSGVDASHPDLASSYRGGANSWFDPNGEHATPYDVSGHGTGTMGILVGGDAGGSSIGMAPGAQWIAAKIFNDAGAASYSAIHAAFQWFMDPDGSPETDDAPNVVNGSWALNAPGVCVDEFTGDVDALRAAGILPVFSAGNFGPNANTSASPANYTSSLSVGATDSVDLVLNDSARGPSACTGGIFPLISAPGSAIKTSDLSFGGLPLYAYMTGTSAAAPHVSGAAALLLACNPELTVEQVEAALLAGAEDISPAGPDNTYGHGRLDVLASYSYVEASATSAITYPADGEQLPESSVQYIVTGTASCSLNCVSLVEVSADLGATWSPVVDTSGDGTWSTWEFGWTPPSDDVYILLSRATDAIGRVESPGAGVEVVVGNINPLAVSASAANGTEGVPQQVDGVWSDKNGAADIKNAYMQIGSIASGGLTRVMFSNKLNRLYLLNEAGTAWTGGFEPGSPNVISNSKVSLDCSSTTVTPSGDTMTVSFNITPQPGFTGVRPLMLYAIDLAGASTSGWSIAGYWDIASPGSAAPEGLSASAPDGAEGFPTQVAASWSDGNGAADIATAYLQVGSVGSGGLTRVSYNNQTGLLYLMNDAGNGWLGGFAPGTANVISNSSVSLDCSGSSASHAGNVLNLSLKLTPSTGFTGNKPLMLYAYDLAANHPAGWVIGGYWNIDTAGASAPVNVSASAADGVVDTAQQVVAVWSDANGASDIKYAYLQVGSTLSGGKTRLYYNNQSGLLYLLNDAGNGWLGGYAPGSANVIANSSVSLDCSQTTVTPSGNTLTISFNITPLAGFTGVKPLMMYVFDNQMASPPGWEIKGRWMILDPA